jgi:hypothetical protein
LVDQFSKASVMRIHALVGAILLGALCIHQGIAAERRATSQDLRTTVDPPGTWRVIGANRATSDCIGETTTPICAIETRLACFDRRIVELCFLADQTSDARRYNLSLPGSSDDVYRIETIRAVTRLNAFQRMFLEKYGDKYPNMTKVGDVYMHMRLDQCAKSRQACKNEPQNGFGCFVRQTGATWKVLDCFGDGIGPDD